MIIMEYIFVFVFGLLIGSFLNVCIWRLPREESIVKPPSHCVGCGNRLGPLDLVPVFSFLFLRGRCRYCKVKISVKYPLIELLTGVVFIALYIRTLNIGGNLVDFAASAFLMSILIAVFFIDLEHMIIPDGLVITGLVGGAAVFVYNIFMPIQIYGDRNWWNPLLGLLPGSIFWLLIGSLGMLIYKDDAMGGGDIKIFAPIGIFLGWKMTIVATLSSVFIGGFVSLILILVGIKNRKSTIPFGPFIVIGTFVTMMWGTEILNWYVNNMLAF
ncbi:MAG: prepilin peptidase [Clostridia bacterium]|nr:prepilin peptidase [Clostridia bacterium]